MRHFETDILVIGSGGAGIYAAIAAARAGKRVIVAERSLIGRGGATVMAQMTVAAAVGEETPDDWTYHLADTLRAGRDLCDRGLAAMVCEDAIPRIREMDDWKVGWARENGHMRQVHAPGHDRPRCVYVDFLNTGPAVSRTLRTQLGRHAGVRRLSDLYVVDIAMHEGEACGAVALHLTTGEPVTLAAKATIVATGGLTRLFRRNSASFNMGGDGYALALRAGAELIDMEFVQFFPIGHLAPRLIGMDPIMWDPFRYKLGGKLLNGLGEEFEESYSGNESGVGSKGYRITRDRATYAITKEVEAGRGSPAGGAYLSFQHIPEAELRRAFGPIVERLARNGIDLTKMPVEVAPIAHYHMGGIRVSPTLESTVPNLFAAGEAVGGAFGANRLSGNGITEALVFGERSGRHAAARAEESAAAPWSDAAAAPILDLLRAPALRNGANPAELVTELQRVMGDDVGPFRTAAGLERALVRLREMQKTAAAAGFGAGQAYDAALIDRLDLRNMLRVAETVTSAALARTESRGAHQREDFPEMDDAWTLHQVARLRGDAVDLTRVPA